MRRPKIEPVVWQPPKLGLRSLPKPNLPKLTVLPVNGHGTEDVLVDDKGAVYTGVKDGRILRLTADGRRLDTIADTGGRPLGLELYPDGRLLVCDATKGLLLVDRRTGAVETLVPGGPNLRICNNAAVAADGTVYFTDSSSRFDLDYYKADLIEHSGTGRLLRRTPDGAVDTLMKGLHFANGVALAPDESYVVVAQTGAYRLDKLWLTGAHEGETIVLDDNLPGFPDNISTGSDGLIWITLASTRLRVLDRLHTIHPVVRKVIWALPDAVHPKEKRVVWVRAIDGENGRIVRDFFAQSTEFHMVTGVREHQGSVYLGSLEEPAIATFTIPASGS
jgi:sugar lactone lactonase YvrE